MGNKNTWLYILGLLVLSLSQLAFLNKMNIIEGLKNNPVSIEGTVESVKYEGKSRCFTFVSFDYNDKKLIKSVNYGNSVSKGECYDVGDNLFLSYKDGNLAIIDGLTGEYCSIIIMIATLLLCQVLIFFYLLKDLYFSFCKRKEKS